MAVVLPQGSDQRAATLYQSQYLTVTGASAKHMLAMKLVAGRLKDHGDIAMHGAVPVCRSPRGRIVFSYLRPEWTARQWRACPDSNRGPAA